MWVYGALLYRILFTGYERLVVKRLGHESDSLAGAFLFNISATLVLVPFCFFVEPPQDYHFLNYALLSALMYAFANFFYFKSLQGEISLVSPLYYFSALFVLVLSVLFLNETFTLKKCMGTILLVFGAGLLSPHRNILKSFASLFSNPFCFFMIICSMFTGIGRVIDGGAVQSTHPFWYGLALYLGVTIFLGCLLIYRRKMSVAWKLWNQKAPTAFLSGFLNSTTYLCGLYTFSKLEVSVAEPFTMLSMIVSLFLGYALLGENIKRRLWAVLIIFLGAWFLF